MTLDEIKQVVELCSFPHWEIRIRLDDSRPYLQVYCPAGMDNHTGETVAWSGRKWMLSPHMVKNEIVATAFKAVMTAMEHEVREMFHYRGVPIFNPHLDPDKLAEFASDPENIQERENSLTGV